MTDRISSHPAGLSRRQTVLLIEDRSATAARVKAALKQDDRQVLVCASTRELLALLPECLPDLILFSADLRELSGADTLSLLKRRAPGVPLMATTHLPSIDSTVQLIRAGAVGLQSHPINPAILRQAVAEAMSEARGRRDLVAARQQQRDRHGFSHMLTVSPRMLRVFDQIRAVAVTDASVLILGETGTGKELVSRAIHERSRRSDQPLISVNCGAFTETLLESELFGHEKGSFTSASGRRQGVFEMADGGTLFLDELGETSLSVQVNLLRVLETMSFRRVGGHDEVQVDVRIIAATHVDLDRSVEEGRFRRDLYYRLNVFPIFLPPLRKRREDIPLLIRHFLERAAEEYGFDEPPAISAEAMGAILTYHWPGNVRQLRSLCERWVIVSGGREVTPDMLPRELKGAPPMRPDELTIDDGVPMKAAVARVVSQIERAYLHRLLQKNRGVLGKTAEAAGITRRTLYNKMKAYQLDAADYRDPS
ncbi:MAG: two-component system NtrC family response regulator [Myxococcota bacterium]|jgi:two-component system NtrC family response regulator